MELKLLEGGAGAQVHLLGISALIYKSEGADIVISQLFVIVILGVMIIGVSNILKKTTYYSDGHFKDQYLLDVLNELEYFSE